MHDIVKAYDGLPWLVKLILALPGIDGIAWGLYRVFKGLSKKDNVLVIIGILWIFLGIFILWIIDMVSIILYKKLVWLA
ncbi:MAG: hypothetical protein KKH92_07040 [Firmicutes bacterium]|nr:hypothetical protein [Bacillota bacterium]